MDRRRELLALGFVALCAAGCTAPHARREAKEHATGAHAQDATEAPEQTAAAVEETLRKLSFGAAADSGEDHSNTFGQSPSTDRSAADSGDTTATELSTRATATSTAHRISSSKLAGSGESTVNRQTLLDVIDQMEAAGVLDAKARGQLLDDLKQTDPALWPQLLAYFQASLARETLAREKPSAVKRAAAVEPERIEDADEVIVSDSPEVARRPGRSASQAVGPARQSLSPDAAKQATKPVVETDKPVEPEPVRKSAPAAAIEKTAIEKSTAEKTAIEKSTAEKPAIKESTVAQAPAEAAERSELDWREHLTAAITGLEKETSTPPDNSAAVGRHAALRLLYLADGRRNEAVKPIAGVPAAQQDFWSKELFGLATYLDAEHNHETSRRAAEAGLHLQAAAGRLAELATLQVKNLSFCTEVSSFGVYKKFEQYEFQAGQEVLLYAEVENFRSESTDKGFHTAFKASYQILDSHGARVAEHEFKLTEEYCQNARRDYFTNYYVWLPKRIYGGNYTLQLTLEDTKGQKIGQSSIEFTIKEKP